MADLKQNPDDYQLNWFWKLTTKWWFFPVFYLSLALLLTIMSVSYAIFDDELLQYLGFDDIITILSYSVGFLFMGFIFLFDQIFSTSSLWLRRYVIYIIYIVIIVSLIGYFYSIYKKRIPKIMIILLILFLILCFVGCSLKIPSTTKTAIMGL